MKYIYLVVIMLFIACNGKDQKQMSTTVTNEDRGSLTHALIVIAAQDFRDEEFREPYETLSKSGVKVVIASTDTLPATGLLGMAVKPQIMLDDVASDSFDVLIIVGGAGCKSLWDNTTLHKIVQDFNDADKLIAAICIAPVVLARAGILNGIEVTAYPQVETDITKCGGVFIDTNICVDSNIITGSGPQAAKDFAATIRAQMSEH
jgi:protease I